MDSRQAIIAALYDIQALQFGQFTLNSGQTSSVYLNLRKIISYPMLLQQISNLIWEEVKNFHFDVVCGVPYAALPIATCLSLKHNIPMIMRRKEKKEYGTKQTVEGDYKVGARCLIIEDVVTTGSSIIETAQDLVEAGLVVENIAAVTARSSNGIASLNQQFQISFCFTLNEILISMLSYKKLDREHTKLIEAALEEQI
jgi:orotate phosphoribosyltransferase